MTPSEGNEVVIPGRPPAVTDDNGARMFCAGRLRARREVEPGGGAVVVLGPCTDGLHREVCRVVNGVTVEPGDGTPLQNFTAEHSDAGVRIDCLDAMDFWCLLPHELFT